VCPLARKDPRKWREMTRAVTPRKKKMMKKDHGKKARENVFKGTRIIFDE
jgi:hypothetical protein